MPSTRRIRDIVGDIHSWSSKERKEDNEPVPAYPKHFAKWLMRKSEVATHRCPCRNGDLGLLYRTLVLCEAFRLSNGLSWGGLKNLSRY
jgi:hypothetical protein